MGTNGSVSFLFEQKGMIGVPSEGLDEENFLLEAIEAGAEDVIVEEGATLFMVMTERTQLFHVRNNLEAAGYTIEQAELVREAMTETKVDAELARANFSMIEKFEENDDVTNVFTNLLMDDETMNALEE
jgi:transcriptional/translational regulatory protein YebC/TACO1